MDVNWFDVGYILSPKSTVTVFPVSMDILQSFNHLVVGSSWTCILLAARLLFKLVLMNIISSVNRLVRIPGNDGISLMYRLNRSGERKRNYLCGTPAAISRGVEKESSCWTWKILFFRNDFMMSTSFVER